MNSVRLDVWLDVACLFKTRSEAQRACKGGKVVVNGIAAKPHRDVRLGDELVITRPGGKRQHVVVSALADRHVAKAEARTLYEDRTPPPRPEEIELRRLERLFRATAPVSRTKPARRVRKALERDKWRDG